jgi:hypothetical protein
LTCKKHQYILDSPGKINIKNKVLWKVWLMLLQKSARFCGFVHDVAVDRKIYHLKLDYTESKDVRGYMGRCKSYTCMIPYVLKSPQKILIMSEEPYINWNSTTVSSNQVLRWLLYCRQPNVKSITKNLTIIIVCYKRLNTQQESSDFTLKSEITYFEFANKALQKTQY